MKSTELRIGNLVQYNGNLKETGKITTIFQDFISGLDYCQINYRNNKKHWLINIEPIPLTEELLLKMGYDLITESHYALSGHLIWKCNDLFMCDKNGIILKHVHQLQNLYFAITNNELTIKL